LAVDKCTYPLNVCKETHDEILALRRTAGVEGCN
jgi:hypothetical protein